MRSSRASALTVSVLLVVLGTVFVASAGAQRSTFRGQFQCDDRGAISNLDGMAVELWKRGDTFWPVEWVGSRVGQGFTDSNGRFSLRTQANEEGYFVRMALRDAHGVHLRDFWGINDWSIDLGLQRNDAPSRNYGSIVFSTAGQSHKCAIWSGVHKANEAFRAETGTELPTRGVEIQADAVTAGTPFTPGTSILWPGGYRVGPSAGNDTTTRHEYAHAMRHGMDGDFGHFVGDAATFNYAQNHESCSRTNPGFAFNEGWAEFWAQSYPGAPDCGSPGDMNFEGNVAAALTELMANCAGGQRKLMVENLRRNPLRIHSFVEFRDLFGCPIPLPVPVYVVAASAEIAPPPSPPTIRAGAAREEASAATKRIRGLEKSLTLALKKAKSPPACKKEPCKTALRTLTRPATLKFQLKVAKIQRSATAKYDTPGEQSKLEQLSIDKLLKDDAKQEARDRKKLVRAALTGVKEALKAGQPVFATDSSKPTKSLQRDLGKALKRFGKATKKGSALPGALTLGFKPFKPDLRRIARPRPQTPPTPSPVATIRGPATTTLTLQCPASPVVPPNAIVVGGTLAGAPAGSQVKVTFTHANAKPVTVVAVTDAAGNWSASHLPGPNDTQTWTVNASYAGDSKHLPANSPPCQVIWQ